MRQWSGFVVDTVSLLTEVGNGNNQYVHNNARKPESQAEEDAYSAEIKTHAGGMDLQETYDHMRKKHGSTYPEAYKDLRASRRNHEIYHEDALQRGPATWDPWNRKFAEDDHFNAVLKDKVKLPAVTLKDRITGEVIFRGHPMEGTVPKGTVLFRGIGDAKELLDAAKAGNWRSHGKFSYHGPEGVLQMAGSPKDIAKLAYKPYGQAAQRMGYTDASQWNAGYKHVVAIDASEMRVRGLQGGSNFVHGHSFDYPSVAAGWGAVRPVDLRRVLSIRDIGPGGSIRKEENTVLLKRFRHVAGIK